MPARDPATAARRRRPARLAGPGVAALLAAAAAAGAAPAAPDSAGPAPVPAWPLPLPTRYLTSNFMEPRPGRFHAGIDLKTDARAGFPVAAAEEGWVDELRAAPDGYGRVVVVRGRSGRRFLYAHLERLADPLRAAVEAEQRRAGRYRVELRPEPGAFPVARGEVIGLSGQSGTPGPHLHFEVRDAVGRAHDPLAVGFAVPDTFPPRIVRLLALPAAPDGRVAGGLDAVALADTAGLRGELPPLAVRGPVAFAAELVEHSDARRHRLAPAVVRVRLDGDEVFAARNTVLPLADQTQRRLEWLETAGRRAQWLWRDPACDLPGRAGGPWSLAPPGLAPGRHRLELEVADAAGNAARAGWWLDVAGPEAVAPGSAAGWELDPIALELPDRGGGPVALTPFLELRGGPPARPLPLLRPVDDEPPVGWRRVLLAPGPGSPLLAAAALYVAPDTLGDAAVGAARRAQGLRAAGGAALFLAPAWPAAGRVTVAWPGPAPAEAADRRVGVFAQQEDGAWTWAGRLAPPAADDADSAWTFALPGPGRYALWRDDAPPVFGAGPAGGSVRRQPPRRVGGVALPRWEVVAIPLDDAGSGVDPASVAGRLDGRPLVVEPDPPRERVLVELPDSLGAGPHRLELIAADRCGNAARRHWALALGARD